MIYYIQGSAILNEGEMFDKDNSQKIESFYKEIRNKMKPKKIEFSTGVLSAETAQLNMVEGKHILFEPIGKNLPLNIRIIRIYTGKYPKGDIFSKTKGMLFTSAVKSIYSYGAKPRAMNFLKKNVLHNTSIETPAATEEGTPTVFYSPALIDDELILDLTMVFDQFPQEAFNTVNNIFQGAAKIPLFLAKGAFLLTVGSVIKLAGSVGEKLFDCKPIFDITESLKIHIPGFPQIEAGFLLITDQDLDSIEPGFRNKYKLVDDKLVDDKGNEYEGDMPYIIISLDGTRNDELKSFVPAIAGASILSKFLGIKENTSQESEQIINAIKIFNDYTYRKEIDKLDGIIKKLPAGDSKIAELEEKRKSLENNILDELFKPS